MLYNVEGKGRPNNIDHDMSLDGKQEGLVMINIGFQTDAIILLSLRIANVNTREFVTRARETRLVEK